MPVVDQATFDRLLWASDLNVVRGEDSLVRAIWAGAPFVWQLYPQADGAHGPKLEAFLERLLDDAAQPLREAVGKLFRAWNGLGPWPQTSQWCSASGSKPLCQIFQASHAVTGTPIR